MERNREHLLELSRQAFRAEEILYETIKALDICKNDGDETLKLPLQKIEIYITLAEKLIEKAGDEADKLLLGMWECPGVTPYKKE